MKNFCNICKRPMGNLNDATTEDCGGDCLKCMAELVKDPDCMHGMLEIYSAQVASLTAENERLKAAMTPDYFYGEGLEEQVFDSVLEVLEEFESEDPFLEPAVLSIDTAIRGPRIWVSVTPANNADGFLYREHHSQVQALAALADIAAALFKEREEDALALKNMELNR